MIHLLEALVESQELGGAGWELRISPVWYSPEDFTLKRSVSIDRTHAFDVSADDLQRSGLSVDTLGKYVVSATHFGPPFVADNRPYPGS